ncbi:MAG: CPBP family intramembrane metalloprotease [Anaerolineae bacterium]|nr:CPBP family intramembrane metalloprotease [Anaerolineae bacterium]
MPAEEVLFTVFAVCILSVIVAAANYADREHDPRLRRVVIVTLVLINVLILLVYGVFQVVLAYMPEPDNDELTRPDKPAAFGALIIALILFGLASAVLSRRGREAAARLFPRFRNEEGPQLPARRVVTASTGPELQPDFEGTPLFPQMLNYYTTTSVVPFRQIVTDTHLPGPVSDRSVQHHAAVRGFSPDSTVHLVALVLCLFLLGTQFIGFVLGGGLSGVAEDFSDELTAWDLVLNGLPLVVLPLVGVGLGLRRDLRLVFKRLGIHKPGVEELRMAGLVVVGLFVCVVVMASIWMGLVSAETYEEQTQASQALADSVDTLWLAFLLAAVAAVSEEIAFRGALQPVFGFWPTAVLFALTHLQYTLTPATLIILVVAVAFGWLRQRYSTTAAIVAHFFYNFIPLALSVAAPEEALSLLLKLF